MRQSLGSLTSIPFPLHSHIEHSEGTMDTVSSIVDQTMTDEAADKNKLYNLCSSVLIW